MTDTPSPTEGQTYAEQPVGANRSTPPAGPRRFGCSLLVSEEMRYDTQAIRAILRATLERDAARQGYELVPGSLEWRELVDAPEALSPELHMRGAARMVATMEVAR